MSAPTSSFQMGDLDDKNMPISVDTLLLKDTEDTNLLKEIQLGNLSAFVNTLFTWGVSDEDSPLNIDLLYTTEAASATRILDDVILSLKNAPTGSAITADIKKETGVNTNVFATIFSTLPTIDINEFTSQTAAVPAVISDNMWEVQRRLQILLTVNDSNFIASGLKVELVK